MRSRGGRRLHQGGVGAVQTHDRRGAEAESEPAFRDDPGVAYSAGQTLARRLRTGAASNGIVYPSVRHTGGACGVAFRPDLVQNLRQGDIWRLEWQGAPTRAMTRLN